MSRLARRTMFAAPLVVTASLGACGSEKKAATPAAARDAAVAAPEPPVIGTISSNGACYELPPRKGKPQPVPCPPDGPSLIEASATKVGNIDRTRLVFAGYDRGAAECIAHGAGEPMPVPCPDALLAHLGPGTQPTRTDGDHCYWNDVEVACPKTPAEQYGFVRVVGKGCMWEEAFDCPPTATCNPPEPRTIACPDPAVEAKLPDAPIAPGGLAVHDDGTCWFEANVTSAAPLQVKCPTEP